MGELLHSVFGVRLSIDLVDVELFGLLSVVCAGARHPARREELPGAEISPAARREPAGRLDTLAPSGAAHAAQSAFSVQHAQRRGVARFQPAEGGGANARAAGGPSPPHAARRRARFHHGSRAKRTSCATISKCSVSGFPTAFRFRSMWPPRSPAPRCPACCYSLSPRMPSFIALRRKTEKIHVDVRIQRGARGLEISVRNSVARPRSDVRLGVGLGNTPRAA